RLTMPTVLPARESPPFDAVIVGAGASAVHAALPLARAGWRIAIVQPAQGDGNARDDDPESVSVPVSDFVTLRRTDEQQHRYFLGADARGVPFGPVRAGAQLTATREHVARDLGPLSAIRAPDFSAMQSFIPGGLG